MKKIANFLVKNRFVALVIMLVVTIICGVLAATVPINKDRTKYLADDSNMKQGIAIMEVAFPETKDTAAIRVMFDDLTTEQIANVKARLEAIPNVSEVIYEADNEKYNKENHTLFVVHADFGYNTDEELAIEKAIETGFPEYTMVYKNNDIPLTELPIWIILLGLSLAIIILIVISSSWLDPVLFLVTIGIAIIINFGTNVIFPYTDELTITVGPILQLVLSMDYSIILMNRYRQEKDKSSNKIEAMKTALAGSISSIASSSLTTVVGLLALVFLSFKLGPELGIVLAKGVFISMLSVFTVLPVMILSMDKWLEKTRKKSPHISMRLLTKISYKIRHAMPIIFVILLVGSFILQRSVTITFTEDSEDQLVDVFPKDNTIVIVYNNEDEGNINGIVTELEKDNRVSSVLGYSNTLGKAMDAEEMSEAINEFDGKERIDKNIVSMIYFIAADGELPTLTVVEFMNFIVDSVIPNETLNAYVDNNIRDNIEYFEKFSDKEKLTTALTIEEMADFFGIEKERVEQLYLYYTIQNGVADSGKMTLPTFIDFVLNTVAKDETYGAMLDSATLSSLGQLNMLIQIAMSKQGLSSLQMAQILKMGQENVSQLYYLYFSADPAFQQETAMMKMPLAEFMTLLKANISSEQMAQFGQMERLIDFAVRGQQFDARTMAGITGMDVNQVAGIYMMNSAQIMTLPNFLVAALELAPTNAELQQLNQIVQLAVSGTALEATTLANLFGIEVTQVYQLFGFALSSAKTIALDDFLGFLVNSVLPNQAYAGSFTTEQVAQLQYLYAMISASVNETAFTSIQLAAFLGMEAIQAEQLYILYIYENGGASWKLSPQVFVSFAVTNVLGNEEFKEYFDQKTADDLKLVHALIEAVVSEKEYTVSEMFELLTSLMDEVSKNEIEVMYCYYQGVSDADSDRKMTIPQFFTCLSEELMNDERFTTYFNAETRADIRNNKADLNEAIVQMKSDTYSRLVITSDYIDESTETKAHVTKINELCKDNLKEYYLVGNSIMVSEMEESFDKEYLMITLITAVSIFLVVLIAFHNPTMPLLLTLVVQCGVFITVSVIGAYTGSIYYLALLIVQSILMGATIDYGIVFCNFYKESRKTMDIIESLKAAYIGSIHTIMTSGSILVLVLAVLGIFATSPMVSEVCTTLSIGALVAMLLIIFVLPGMVVCFDRLIKKRKSVTKTDQ